MIIKNILKIVAILVLGVIGSLIFQAFIFPYLLVNPYFEKFQFVKDFKQGKIVINPKEQVYIQENTALEKTVERVEKSVVAIQGKTKAGDIYLSSGLIATSDGLVITLANLVPADSRISIFVNGEKVNHQVLKRDYKNNLALIKIGKNNLATVGFSALDKIKLGERVFLLASASTKADNWLANEGIIRNFDQNTLKTNISEKYIVAGSPLFDISGELVGLNYIDSDGKISAISVDEIKEFLGL
jgi:S1-C subfamily serine protease